jgi:hypothetical protein
VNTRFGRVFLLLCMSLPFVLGAYNSLSYTDQIQFFPETGHVITGEFLKVYKSASNPEQVFGFPITDQYVKPTTGFEYQFFQKALLIQAPESVSDRLVHRVPLGELLYEPGSAPSHSPNSMGCRGFPDSGNPYKVCYAFLDFFEKNGGVGQFGYPISDFENKEGLIVQYFQYARLEWHPELPAGQGVVVSNLGADFFNKNHEDPQLLLQRTDNNILQSILNLRVNPFPVFAVTSRNDSQKVYVIVQDQNFRPISNAKVNMTVSLPSGKKQFYDMGVTDQNGITSISFDIVSTTTGIAEVYVTTIYENFTERSITSFRIWW